MPPTAATVLAAVATAAVAAASQAVGFSRDVAAPAAISPAPCGSNLERPVVA